MSIFLVLLPLTLLRKLVALMVTWALGALYGYSLVRFGEKKYPRLAGLVRFFENLFSRFGVWFLVVAPTYTSAALAGAAGAGFLRVGISLGLGQLVWIGLTLRFGQAIGDWTAPLVNFLSAHVVESTVVCVLLVIVQQWLARRSKARQRKPDLEV